MTFTLSRRVQNTLWSLKHISNKSTQNFDQISNSIETYQLVVGRAPGLTTAAVMEVQGGAPVPADRVTLAIPSSSPLTEVIPAEDPEDTPEGTQTSPAITPKSKPSNQKSIKNVNHCHK